MCTGGDKLTLGRRSADADRAHSSRALLLMPDSPPITVLVARFDDLLAHGLRHVIDSDDSLEIVAADVDHRRLGVVMRAHHPQVAILDVDALSCLAEVRVLSEAHPDVHLVLLVSQATAAEGASALAFGASAFLGHNTQARDVLTAIHLAARGLQMIPLPFPDARLRPSAGPQLLTAREAEILPMLQQGSANLEIARALGIGIETVRSHARNIYAKLGVSSRRELAGLPPRDLDADHRPLAPAGAPSSTAAHRHSLVASSRTPPRRRQATRRRSA